MNSLNVCMFHWLVKKIVPDTEKNTDKYNIIVCYLRGNNIIIIVMMYLHDCTIKN